MIYFLTNGDYSSDKDNFLSEGITITTDEGFCRDTLLSLPFLGYDKETTSLNTILAKQLLDSIGDKDIQVVIDRTTIKAEFLQEIADKRKLYGHNIQYDMSVSLANDLVIKNIYDTMHVEQRLGLGSGRPNNLKDVYERRTGKPFPTSKDVRKEFEDWPEGKKFESKHIIYSAGDISTLESIIEAQKEMIDFSDMQFLMDIENNFTHILCEIEYEGWYLKEDQWRELIEIAKKERYLQEIKMDSILEQAKQIYPNLNKYIFKRELISQPDLFGGSMDINPNTFNYSSSDQVLEIFRQVSLPVPSYMAKDEVLKKKVLKESMAEEALNTYLITYPNSPLKEFVDALQVYAKVVKKISSFGERFLVSKLRKKGTKTKIGYKNPKTGKVHTNYEQCATDNCRLSSGDEKNGYYNSQQLPKDNRYRVCFSLSPQEIAEGWKVCTMDLSGAEVIIAASLSGELKVLDYKDIHSELATPAYRKVLRYIRDSFCDDEEKQIQEALLLLSNTKGKATRQLAIHSLENWQTFTISKNDPHLAENRDDFKKVVYGLFYGGTAMRIAQVLNVPLKYAEIIEIALKTELPLLFKYLDDNAQLAKTQGKITFNKRTNSRHIFEAYLKAAQYNRELTYGERGEMERASKNYPRLMGY